MQCITVFPILKRTFTDTLMYWSSIPCAVGDVIQVKMQNRNIWAVVDEVIPVHQAKEYIKSQTFTIRKIDTLIKTDAFSREFILAVLDTARYYVRPFGEVFSELVPKKILENLESVSQEKQKNTTSPTLPTTHYIQAPLSERIETIKQLQLANPDTYIVVPIKTHEAYLKKAGCSPVLMPIDLYRLDQSPAEKTICVLELASSEYYRHLRKDFDIRFFLRAFCKRKKITLYESDTILPIYATRPAETLLPAPLSTTPTLHLIDMTESGRAKVKTKQDLQKKSFLFSPELISLIRFCEKKKESLLLYTVRKGLSHQTVCADCKHLLSCTTCQKPLHLKDLNGEKMYVCDSCHTTQTANLACPICSGWNLIPFGTHTEILREELEQITDMPIVIIDSNNQTKSSAKKALQKKDSTLYIGTELLLTQSIDQQYTHSAIISLESLLGLPSRNAEFDAARVIYTLMERTTKDLLIQTRNPAHPIWQAIKQKDWQPLISHIYTDTEEAKLPPYNTHIQISARSKELDQIRSYIQRYTPVQTTTHQNREILHMFFEHGAWPDLHIYPYLKTVPASIDIQVDKTNFV